jgi:hypothetical protein
MTMQRFSDSTKIDPQSIVDHEAMLLNGLKFQLTVYTPYRSMDGFMAHLEG